MSSASITDKIAGFWRSYLSSGKSILVAVSGGSDSVALVYLLCQLRESLNIKKLAIAHINHGLRGTESDGDEQFVREIALKLDVPFFLKRLSGHQIKDPGIESWARKERYCFLHSVMGCGGYDYIATGHTADDQAETVIFRMLRGAGIKGLRGILPLREDKVIRPLLFARKMEIINWLDSKKLPFRTDSSNKDISLSRNFIRHQLLSGITDYDSSAVDKLVALSLQMQDSWSIVQNCAKKWVDDFVIEDLDSSFSIRSEGFSDRSVASEGLKLLFESHGIPASRYHIDRIFANLAHPGTFLLPGKWQYNPSKATVYFQKGVNSDADLLCRIPLPGVAECRSRNIKFTITESEIIDKNNLDKWSAFLDRDSICGDSLTYRLVDDEDVFCPLGQTEATNVLRFLAKQGIPKSVRCRTGVIVDECNKVLWIPGIRLSQSCAVKKSSRSVIKIASKILGNNV